MNEAVGIGKCAILVSEFHLAENAWIIILLCQNKSY